MSAKTRKPVLIVGLGRFGGAIARTLERMGHEVLGADTDPRLVQEFAGDLTKVVEADCTEVTTLEQLEAIIETAEDEGRDAVLLRVQRRGSQAAYVAVRLR